MRQTTASAEWFAVDRKGLANILRRRGIEFAVFELIQNSWDEAGVTNVRVTLQPYEERGYSVLEIEDDAPEGFKDLRHAFTLFADSEKKKNATQRGRFNLGEKLVLALCKSASIETTTGSVVFDPKGRRVTKIRATDRGSVFNCILKMGAEEREGVSRAIETLIPPRGIDTFFNGRKLQAPDVMQEILVTLPTEIADDNGDLRRTARQTIVRIYRPWTNDTPMIYEMGIPVVEHDCPFHCDVQQKVPLTIDRENVAPVFVRQLHVAVFNNTYDRLSTDEMNAEWVQTAMESSDVMPEAVQAFANKKFGEKRVSYDPSDPEANKIAVSGGFTVVHGGMMSSEAWENIRRAEAIKPAGQVTPSAKSWTGEGNPNAAIAEPIPREKWTPNMVEVAEYAQKVAREIMGRSVAVQFYSTLHMLAGATYGCGTLSFNKLRLTSAWFNLATNQVRIDSLLIHEFGHEYESDHLSKEYYHALTDLGARFVRAVREGRL